MFKRYQIRAMLCMVLALVMVFDIVVVPPAQAKIEKRDVLLVGAGAIAGAGLALAGPAIGGAVASVAGGIAGAAVAGVTGLVGAVGGILGTVATAIGGALSAVGGFIAGIISSPLFIPALVVVGLAVAGYLIYKKGYKDGKRDATSTADDDFVNDAVYVAPTDYEMSNTIPEGDSPVSLGTSDEIITIASSDNTVTASEQAPTQSTAAAAVEQIESTGAADTTNSASVEEAYLRYKKAYNTYTSLVTNSGGADSATINAAMKEYREAWTEYNTLKGAANNQ